jgi:hypothetical protein
MKDEALYLRDPILWRSIHQYDRATHDARLYSGTILLDGQEVAQTLQCRHCQAHFLNVKIPGQERGWCMRCNGPVCPRKECDVCTPFEAWLESVEKGIPIDQLPIKAAIRGAFFEK